MKDRNAGCGLLGVLALAAMLGTHHALAEAPCAGKKLSAAQLERKMSGLLAGLRQSKAGVEQKKVEVRELLDEMYCELNKADTDPLNDRAKNMAIDYQVVLEDVLDDNCSKDFGKLDFAQRSAGASHEKMDTPSSRLAFAIARAMCRQGQK